MALTTDDPKVQRKVLEAWIHDLHALFDQVKKWSDKQGWATLRDEKMLQERELGGEYKAPVLLIHTPKGRLLLDPYARFVFDGDGAIDVCVYPSFGTPIKLVRKPKKASWWIWDTREDDGAPQALVEASFVQMVRKLQESP